MFKTRGGGRVKGRLNDALFAGDDNDKEDDDGDDVGENDIREEQAWWLEFKVTSRRKARQLLRLVLILHLVIGREN